MKKNVLFMSRRRTLYRVRLFMGLVMLLCTQLPVLAQNLTTVIGNVTYPSGEPIPGVTIVLKGTSNGTTTNAGGRYSLSNVPSGATLVFSFVGMKTQNVVVTGSTLATIVMQEEESKLDEIVVVGYGTQKRRDLTGAISSVSAQAIKEMPVTSAEQGLQGRLAGVQVIQSNSAPGGAISIRVRGGNSVLGGNEPLYVIDGFPVYNSIGSNDGQTQPTNPMSAINPNDIVSMEVLKDASATAIYGARGANGVVIITTRRGKAGESRVDFETYYGQQSVRHKIPMMNAQQYMTIANERAQNMGTTLPYADMSNWTANTDWQDVIFQKAPIQNYALSFSGGSENNRYSVSGNWFDQKGIVIGSGFQRGSVRINLDNKVSSRLNLSTSITASRAKTQQARTSISQYNGVIYAALVAPPIAPVYNADGSYYTISNVPTADPAWNNPLALATGFISQMVTDRILANTNATYQILPELTLSVRLGIDNSNTTQDQYLAKTIIGSTGEASISSSNGTSFLNENILSYKKQFGQRHSLDAMAGFTWQQGIGKSFSAGSKTFTSDIFVTDNLSAGSVLSTPTSYRSKNDLLSWVGRVNYVFNERILATVSARADGSSRFGAGNKWGFFPSAALAWRLSEENFIKSIRWINELKVRTSIGRTGNQEIGNYNSLARLSAVTAIFGTSQSQNTGYAVTSMPNSDLKWETTTQIDGGIDASLWNGRLNLTLDYYVKNTSDLLAQVPVAISSGFSSILLNSGSIQNRGFEVSVDGVVIDNKRLKWNLGVNFSTNKNTVQKVAVSGGQFFGSNLGSPLDAPVNIVKEGQPLSAFYGYVTDGLWETDQTTGSIQPTAKAGDQRYKDLNGDGAITANDRTILGKPNPDFIYGITSQLTYGPLSLNVLFQGVEGAMVFNANKFSIGDAFARGANQMAEVTNRWTADSPNTTALYQRPSTVNPLISDRFFENASYFRLRNIQLSYNLPVTTFNLPWFRTANIYVSGQNLLTFTKYTGFDPEVSSSGGADLRKGVDVGAYPSAKTITAGIKLGF